MTSPHETNFSHDSRATSRPQTRPGVAAAPDTDAEVLADVSRRTYSAYAAGKESARGDRHCACPSLPGSKRAARRVAASSRAKGSEDGLDDELVVANGSGAGSGQERDCEAKLLGVGRCNVGLSATSVLRCSSLMGSRALVRKSLTVLVWW